MKMMDDNCRLASCWKFDGCCVTSRVEKRSDDENAQKGSLLQIEEMDEREREREKRGGRKREREKRE
jgi:hypothetical protein